MINKYGQHIENNAQHIENHEEPEPIFEPNEQVDFPVGRPKKKKQQNRQPTEAQEERQERVQQEEQEKRKNLSEQLKALKKQIYEYQKKVGKENSEYRDNLDNLQSGRWGQYKKVLEEAGRKNVTKDNIREALIKKNRSNLKKIKDEYPNVFNYIKNHKLNENDMNQVVNHINERIKHL